MFALGARLGKTLSEIEALTVEEFLGWIAFFELKDDE